MPDALPDVPDYLSDWIVTQRWYAGKGRTPQWERIGGFELPDPMGEATITVHLLLDHAEPVLLYQVPTVERAQPLAGGERALIATVGATGGTRFVYDGPHDPAGASALIRLILEEGTARPDDGSPGLAARGHSAPHNIALEVVSSRVLSGEQSNTSIIFDTVTLDGQPATPVICKLFRSLHHGDNPDVTLTSALAGAGSTAVPHSVGHVTGQWRDRGEPSGFAHGHLAFAQEFIPGVEDAWRVALTAAAAGQDFSEPARSLGRMTAEIHTTLAAALPTRVATAHQIAEVVASMRQRFELAVREVPAVEGHRDALEAIYARISASSWPPFQRIHGDYHLGQVLWVPGRGWVALDFEGEPLRPMSERSANDSPLRDVAGMLRSFDYVAGSVELSNPAASAGVWAVAARNAFLDGYTQHSGFDLVANTELLDAFEVDKALYEAVYEARNRPSWLPIPTRAIDTLMAPSTSASA